MILLVGGSGYIGEAFVQELTRRRQSFRVLRRADVDYTQFSAILPAIQALKP